VLIKPHSGVFISGIVTRKKADTTPRPPILRYRLLVRDTQQNTESIKRSVDNGYVGEFAGCPEVRATKHSPSPYRALSHAEPQGTIPANSYRLLARPLSFALCESR
jgi:hypothetical protein